MVQMWAIVKRELAALFVSPLAYILLGVFTLISGFYFSLVVQNFFTMTRQYEFYSQINRDPEMLNRINLNAMLISPLLGFIVIILVLVWIPALTMRSIAEEKSFGTFELLMTSPIRTPQIVISKFIALALFYLVLLSTHLVFVGILFALGNPEWGPIFSGYLGVFLLGIAMIAIGLFASSLTNNQAVALFLAFALSLLFLMFGWAGSQIGDNLGMFLERLSPLHHFENFSKGVITVSDVTYYVTLCAFFLVASGVSLESLRWR